MASDSSDGKRIAYVSSNPDLQRLIGICGTLKCDDKYFMNHTKRGKCIILVYSKFDRRKNLAPRDTAYEDCDQCEKAFKKLRFQVKTYFNLTFENLKIELEKVSSEDHSENDAFALVFMSHGGIDKWSRQEYVWTFDEKIRTDVLWNLFAADKCPTLGGKPKMFFLQCCRGERTDKGIRVQPRRTSLQVEVDSETEVVKDVSYVIPVYADFLAMWASFPGHYAFKSKNNGINGSIFIHYLTKALLEEGLKEDLLSLLVKVTRNVALEYESHVPTNQTLDSSKQMPYLSSTLLRKVFFKD